MENIKNTILVEKYRPQNIDDFVGNSKLKDFIQKCIRENDLPNLLFYGSPGGGKTTLAKMLVNQLDCDYIFINASNTRGIDVVRDTITRFISSVSFKPIKIVVLDEYDYFLPLSMFSMRSLIEEYSEHARFILTCNHLEKVIDPIKSRCTPIKVFPPSKAETASHLDKILNLENIKYENQDLVYIINKNYPDLRKIINNIQIFSKGGKLQVDTSLITQDLYVDNIIKELKSKDKSKLKYEIFNTTRQIIADSGVEDYSELYRVLFENVEEYAVGNEIGLCIITIHDHLHKSNFVIDKEINIMSCISSILNIIKK